jgi:hypothetical protein
MLYVQSFTLIKSTGVCISSPGTQSDGIPSPTTKHSFIGMSIVYFGKLSSDVHDLHNTTTFGSNRFQLTYM